MDVTSTSIIANTMSVVEDIAQRITGPLLELFLTIFLLLFILGWILHYLIGAFKKAARH